MRHVALRSRNRSQFTAILLFICSILVVPASVHAQGGEAEALAKQLANPIASLISVPFQTNWDFQVGPGNDTRSLINFQPVMPFGLSENWNLIQRVILPYISQPELGSSGSAVSGFGDILATSFFSPKQPTHLIWGVGPALQLPISSDPALGSAQWSVGPSFVALKQAGPWTIGALANHLWSVAGDDDRSDVNASYLQPFLSYGTKTGVTFNVNTESSANWEAPSGEEWTVPVIGSISKVTRLGRRPISVAGGAGYYVETPFDGGPEWRLRMSMTLLFPTGAPAGG